jgi:hypothetical protein
VENRVGVVVILEKGVATTENHDQKQPSFQKTFLVKSLEGANGWWYDCSPNPQSVKSIGSVLL